MTHDDDEYREKTVLGAMLQSDEAFAIGLELEPGDFYFARNRRIFSRMLAMHAAGNAVDGSTLTLELMRTKDLDFVGGAAYVADLTIGLPQRGIRGTRYLFPPLR